jgi:aerobic carbon-monoxide dehydrogenase small subunit
MQIELTVNGAPRCDEVEPRLLLVHYLRQRCGLRAANVGCDTTSCGACTVLVNGRSVKSCTMLAVQAAGQEITTAEGLAAGGEMHPVQQAFRQEHGLQCGFCTPGMMLTARALLDRNPDPDDTEIRQAISGQICRCTGYATIVRSVKWAANHPTAGVAAVPDSAAADAAGAEVTA